MEHFCKLCIFSMQKKTYILTNKRLKQIDLQQFIMNRRSKINLKKKQWLSKYSFFNQ